MHSREDNITKKWYQCHVINGNFMMKKECELKYHQTNKGTQVKYVN